MDPYGPRRGFPVLPVLLLGILIGAGGWMLLTGSSATQPRVVTPRGDLAPAEKSTIELFRNAAPSVVFIRTSTLRRVAFSTDVVRRPQGSGSGFLWDQEGHVVTNYHVVQGANEAVVVLSDRSAYKARPVGFAKRKDLAVLKIEAPRSKLRPLPIGTSADLQVGQHAYAIGNPFGLDQTLTSGVVSALGREIKAVTGHPIQGVIQTDAAVNPGNSGGPLLDSAGRLIGVNTAIYSPSGASAGIGFAVPVDTVNRIVPQLIEHGKVVRPGLGVVVLSDYQTRRMGAEGAMIQSVESGSGAAQAGLRPEDLIVRVDDRKIRTGLDLYRALDLKREGEKVEVRVKRNGKERTFQVTLRALSE